MAETTNPNWFSSSREAWQSPSSVSDKFSKDNSFSLNVASNRIHVGYMGVSLNGGTRQPLVFLLNMIILRCFGGTTI